MLDSGAVIESSHFWLLAGGAHHSCGYKSWHDEHPWGHNLSAGGVQQTPEPKPDWCEWSHQPIPVSEGDSGESWCGCISSAIPDCALPCCGKQWRQCSVGTQRTASLLAWAPVCLGYMWGLQPRSLWCAATQARFSFWWDIMNCDHSCRQCVLHLLSSIGQSWVGDWGRQTGRYSDSTALCALLHTILSSLYTSPQSLACISDLSLQACVLISCMCPRIGTFVFGRDVLGHGDYFNKLMDVWKP